ncbi:MAG: amidohydrolase family protein [Pirellulales bacterium]
MSNDSSKPVCYKAAWLVPVSSPPIADGLITVDQNIILAVGENLSGNAPVELPDSVITPGLVNAHTHLEFSGIEEPIGKQGLEFTQWIPQAVGYRRGFEDQWVESRSQFISKGLDESSSSSIAAVGEISTAPLQVTDYQNSSAQVVSFLELIGRSPNQTEDLVAAAEQHIQQCNEAGIVPGISPHAPYTVHPDTVQQIALLSQKHQFPVAMHLAESKSELQFIEKHEGPFREMLEKFGVWNEVAPPKGTQTLDYLKWLSNSHHALVIHGNYLSEEEIRFLAKQQGKMTVVYCPRTHAFFNHDRHPLPQLLEHQVPVAIGTDSRASTPDLDLWQDVQTAATAFSEIAPQQFLEMVTINAATALGIEDRYGTLAAGKSSACSQFQLQRPVDEGELFEALIQVQPRQLL